MAKKRISKQASRRTSRAKAASKKPSARPKARARARQASAAAPAVRAGVITHTELASTDPIATRKWAQKVLGWKFGDPAPTPTGPYHMWRFENGTGGGIRANNAPEPPGVVPYCEVADIRSTFRQAVAAGATEMLAPQALPGGMGWIAIVTAPGGVPIGLWGLK